MLQLSKTVVHALSYLGPLISIICDVVNGLIRVFSLEVIIEAIIVGTFVTFYANIDSVNMQVKIWFHFSCKCLDFTHCYHI